jgi:hypothetical protein
VESQLATIVEDVIESTNFHVEESEREEENFDPKVAFKSSTVVKRLRLEVIKQSKRQAKRDDEYLFADPSVRTSKNAVPIERGASKSPAKKAATKKVRAEKTATKRTAI